MSAEYTILVPRVEEGFPIANLALLRVRVDDGYRFIDPDLGDKIMEAVRIAVNQWRCKSGSGRAALRDQPDLGVLELADFLDDPSLSAELREVGIIGLKITQAAGWGTSWSLNDPLCPDALP